MVRKMREENVKIIKPGMVTRTTRTLPSGKQVLVIKRDRTLTGIAWRIPVC